MVSSHSWRIVDTGLRSAAENMALDEIILRAVAENNAPNTIRFLRFSKPCVLVGYHQDIEQEVRLDYCLSKGIEINRRITGGGAIYFHPLHLGWEVIAKWTDPFPKNIEKLYEYVCRPVVSALRRLGLNAKFRPKNDIEINGRKISGTGGTNHGDSFLFQGTLLTDLDIREMLKCLKIPVKKLSDKEVESLKERVTTLKWELGYIPDLNQVKKLILEEMCRHFKIEAREGELTEYEKKLLQERLPYFESDQWIYLVKVPKKGIFHASIKVKGGLIRAAVSVREKVIQYTYITGDFFAFPRNLVYEFESRLKHIPLDYSEISETVAKVFEETSAVVPGVKPEDIAKVVYEAASKIHLIELGLTEDEADQIIEVLEPAEYTLSKANYLLLPYCAKPLNCSLRYSEECAKCGLCEFTEIYNTAEKLEFKPITITSYEHLEKTLTKLKNRGEKAWIGSCCEAFYEKHFEDFKRIGLPGLIVTTQGLTCYDLGQEHLAYQGKYEGKSKLRTTLLIKILKISATLKQYLRETQHYLQ